MIPNIGIVAGLIVVGWLVERLCFRRKEAYFGRNATMRRILGNDRRQSPEAKPTGQEVPPGRLHADGGQEQADDGQHHQD